MGYHVEYFEEPDHVCATLTGDISEDDLRSARSEMNSKLLAHNCRRLLVDASGVSQMQSLFTDFEFTSQHSTALPPDTRHAVLINPEHKEHMLFVETVAKNRSIDLELFTDRNLAIKWLGSIG